jgi:branched-chain amino acid transport system substrate-binding protein
VSALGFPAISHGQSDRIKIGHLTPLTGFSAQSAVTHSSA